MTQEMKKPILVIEKPIPSKAMFLDFEIEQEKWNKYLLEDGSLLRAKFVLTGVLIDKNIEELEKEAKSGQKLRIGFAFKSRNLFSIESPTELRGPPDSKKYSLKELRASIVKEELDFETEKATWNSYLCENGMRMKARISPTSVHMTSKFESSGTPIYVVDSAVDIKLNLPEDIQRIQKEQAKAKMTK